MLSTVRVDVQSVSGVVAGVVVASSLSYTSTVAALAFSSTP